LIRFGSPVLVVIRGVHNRGLVGPGERNGGSVGIPGWGKKDHGKAKKKKEKKEGEAGKNFRGKTRGVSEVVIVATLP